MRLWHYQTIPFLPTAQLLGQWRECCAVARDWANEELRHPLVKPVECYPVEDFIIFCRMVKDEMESRGYNIQEYTIAKLKDNFFKIFMITENDVVHCRAVIDDIWSGKENRIWGGEIFDHWHNRTYLEICYWNLYEKYLCGCIPDEEWLRYLEGGKELV